MAIAVLWIAAAFPSPAAENYYVRLGRQLVIVPKSLTSAFAGKHLPEAHFPPGVQAPLLTIYFDIDFNTEPSESGVIGRSYFSLGITSEAMNQDVLCQAAGPIFAGKVDRIFKPKPSMGATHIVFHKGVEFFGDPILVYLWDQPLQAPNSSNFYQAYETDRALSGDLVLRVHSRTDVIPLEEFPQTLAAVEAAIRSWMPDWQIESDANSKNCITSAEYSE